MSIKQIFAYKFNKENFEKHIINIFLNDIDFKSKDTWTEDVTDEDINDKNFVSNFFIDVFFKDNYISNRKYIEKILPGIPKNFSIFIDKSMNKNDWYIGNLVNEVSWKNVSINGDGWICEKMVEESNNELYNKFMSSDYSKYKSDFEEVNKNFSQFLSGDNLPKIYGIMDESGY
jgi:hypothetical protein